MLSAPSHCRDQCFLHPSGLCTSPLAGLLSWQEDEPGDFHLLPMLVLLHRARRQALAFTNNGFIRLKGDESDLNEIDFLTPADL